MTEMTEVDLRIYPRRLLHCFAKLAVIDKPPLDALTVDIPLDGMSLMLVEPIESGQYCVIKFEVAINEDVRLFSAIARSIYCLSSDTCQYRVGFQFRNLSTANVAIINALKG